MKQDKFTPESTRYALLEIHRVWNGIKSILKHGEPEFSEYRNGRFRELKERGDRALDYIERLASGKSKCICSHCKNEVENYTLEENAS